MKKSISLQRTLNGLDRAYISVPAAFEEPNYGKLKDFFIGQLRAAEDGKESSLSFIENTLPEDPLLQRDRERIIQEIVIGGTNYKVRVEKLKIDGTDEVLSDSEGVVHPLNDLETFRNFIGELSDLRAEAVTISFAFPLDPTVGPNGEVDGMLIHGTKSHSFKGVIDIDQSIGNIVRSVYSEMGKEGTEKMLVSVANDSVCLAKAGEGDEDGSLIVGTGLNEAIIMLKDGKRIIVNLETCNLSGWDVPPYLKHTLDQINARSETPGSNPFEKLVAGQYLVEQFYEIAKANKWFIPLPEDAVGLTKLAKENKGRQGRLAKFILERSASLVAVQIAGVYEFIGREHISLVSEGSLFWNGWNFKDNVEKRLKELNVPVDAVAFKKVEKSDIEGAKGMLTK